MELHGEGPEEVLWKVREEVHEEVREEVREEHLVVLLVPPLAVREVVLLALVQKDRVVDRVVDRAGDLADVREEVHVQKLLAAVVRRLRGYR